MSYVDNSRLSRVWSRMKTYVSNRLSGYQTEHKTASATLAKGATSWTATVSGVTASNTVMVCPAPTSLDEYVSCAVRCTAQASGTLTFTADSAPENALTINVMALS